MLRATEVRLKNYIVRFNDEGKAVVSRIVHRQHKNHCLFYEQYIEVTRETGKRVIAEALRWSENEAVRWG